MAQQQILLSNKLNRTSKRSEAAEKYHAPACYALLTELGFLSEEKVTLILSQGKISDRRNRMLEALQKIIYAKMATLEGNTVFAMELFEAVSDKITVLQRGNQRAAALAYFYYEYASFFRQVGDVNAAYRYLEKTRSITTSNKMKQLIRIEELILGAKTGGDFHLKDWLQSIAYLTKYGMEFMETYVHYELSLQLILHENLADAGDHLDMAHEMSALHGFHYLHDKIDYVRGCLLVNQNRNVEAVEYFKSLLPKTNNAMSATRIQIKLAELYRLLNDADAALEAARQGLELSQKFSITAELPQVSTQLGRLYHREMTDISKAFFYYQQAYGAVISLSKHGISVNDTRRQVLTEYVSFLEEHFPGETSDAANNDLFSFSKDLTWVKIKDLFHYNLFLYHYTNTGVGNKTLEALDFPASSFYSATERLRRRGITFPNFRRSDVEIPAANYVEGLQQYTRLHRDKTWVEINECFEKDMLKYHYKLNNYNKKLLAKRLDLAYSGVVNRTKYLTAGN